MFICRVYIGDYCVGYRNMKLSALYRSDNPSIQYDSFVNDIYNPSIFVINRDYHAFSTHLIEFKIKNQNVSVSEPERSEASERSERRVIFM